MCDLKSYMWLHQKTEVFAQNYYETDFHRTAKGFKFILYSSNDIFHENPRRFFINFYVFFQMSSVIEFSK
jgi:hypothetical protein